MNNQPPPIRTDEVPTVDMVIYDLSTRKAMGIKKYGVARQPTNGRDSLQDAYEEALDLCIYLKNEIRRREIQRDQTMIKLGEFVIKHGFDSEQSKDAVKIVSAGAEDR